jgi:hypothetical protein
MSLPPGDYLLEASVHVTIASPEVDLATVNCFWNEGGHGTMLTGTPPTFKDTDSTMKDDVLRLPTGAIRVADANTTLVFSCTTTSLAAMSLNATVVATQVSVLHDS